MTVAISLMEACMLESLAGKGMSHEHIIENIKNNDIRSLNEFDTTFDFSYLVENNIENTEKIEDALNGPYQVKFVTRNGLKTLLRLKYQLEENEDYKMVDTCFHGMEINDEKLESLALLLSPNWKIEEVNRIEDGRVVINICNVVSQ